MRGCDRARQLLKNKCFLVSPSYSAILLCDCRDSTAAAFATTNNVKVFMQQKGVFRVARLEKKTERLEEHLRVGLMKCFSKGESGKVRRLKYLMLELTQYF